MPGSIGENMLPAIFGKRKAIALFCLFLAITVAAYILFILRLDGPFYNDWSYFNSLSLVVRSTIVNYGVFPGHNPWVCGGLDILTNPQNRVLSPFILLDLLFDPQTANLLFLMAYSFLGLWSAFALMQALGVTPLLSVVTAVLFICGSWFGLHYAEGHIPFASIQILPLIMLCALKLTRVRYRILLTLALAMILLDGGFYAFIFSGFLMLTLLILGFIPVAAVKDSLRHPLKMWGGPLLAFALVAAAKLVPVLVGIGEKQPWLDFLEMPWPLIGTSLLQPFQNLYIPTGIDHPYRFHEYGCYLSIAGLLIIAFAMFKVPGFFKENWRFLAAALLWFWVGSGLKLPVNPWSLYQRLPLVNIAHVQSRVFILMFLFFLILLARALHRLDLKPRYLGAIVIFLIAEALVVRNYPMLVAPPRFEELPQGRLITSTTIQRTGDFAWTPGHYLATPNLGSSTCYEPSFYPRAVRKAGDADYRGEAYFIEPSGGKRAALMAYTPGYIKLQYQTHQPGTIELNTNALYGWRVVAGEATLSGRGGELLKVTPAGLAGEIELRYSFPYQNWIFVSLGLGVVLFYILFRRCRSAENTAASAARKFDYSAFPDGFYHEVMEKGHPIRRAWHEQKFWRVIDSLPQHDGIAVLDIGCFAGTFLSLLPEKRFSRQVGVDILKNQIDYANKHFGTSYRQFVHVEKLEKLNFRPHSFDCVSLIEVIEHLDSHEIEVLIKKVCEFIKPGGKLIITTPNYLSAWPLIEYLLGRFSDVGYEEQHITKFHYFNAIRKLHALAPELKRSFGLDFCTTTHFIAPFLAAFSLPFSSRLSRYVDHKKWRFPFGNLILLSFSRKEGGSSAAPSV
jgi:2-polyprenyl-3-methyl-5-hydroxy-6-metoxy-1,4-benzoquinol methylase